MNMAVGHATIAACLVFATSSWAQVGGGAAPTAPPTGSTAGAGAASSDGMGRPGSSLRRDAPLPPPPGEPSLCARLTGNDRQECLRREGQATASSPSAAGATGSGMGSSAGSAGAGAGGNSSAPTSR